MKKIFYFVALVAISLMFLQCEQNELGQGTGKENGHEYVDLGLSVKWATCNVGAESSEDYGDYFAWGEVEPKDYYSMGTYKYCYHDKLTKYCTQSSEGKGGFTDNKIVLDPEDDAAIVNWGGAWRMPTGAEFTELLKKCKWTLTRHNGVYGYVVKGRNGNSIFLPAAEAMSEGTLIRKRGDYGSMGYYLSSELDVDASFYNNGLFFLSDNVLRYSLLRYWGCSIRPVCP